MQDSNTDFLIGSVFSRLQFPIFTTGKDYQLYAKHLPIKFHAFHNT